MNQRVKYLFLTALVLIVLTQILVLDWEADTVFFVTWFILALTVKHDNRLSAVMGLEFLLICPFLLIANQEPVAEQAANYAYFFLAIGVLVQLEELLLERFGWLNFKLDFSYLWKPFAAVSFKRWKAATQADDQQSLIDQYKPAQSIKIIGAIGLAVTYAAAVLSNGQPAIVLPMLGGAVLLPFLLWGLLLAVRSWGLGWFLRGALVLIGLSLATAEMVWVYDLLNANQLTSLRETYHFIDHMREATQPKPDEEGEIVETREWTINQTTRRVLFQHPAFTGSSYISFSVNIGRQEKLAFDVAMAPESWTLEGDGVAFEVYITADGVTQQVFSAYIDPKVNAADQRWHSYMIDLDAYAGKSVSITFETNVGPAGDYRYDWAGWGEPRLLQP